MAETERLLIWVGGSKRDLMALPLDVRKFFSHALDFAQRGDKHDAAKSLKGFGGAGVLEIVEDDERGHGHHSRQAQGSRGAGKGATTWQGA